MTSDAADSPKSLPISATGTEGYYVADANGSVGYGGDARFYGDLSGRPLASPIIDMAVVPPGTKGYWLLGADGGIFSFGDAKFYGSTGAIHLHRPVVGIAPTRTGHGYWLVASDGGIFAFGDAGLYGSALGDPVPIVAFASDITSLPIPARLSGMVGGSVRWVVATPTGGRAAGVRGDFHDVGKHRRAGVA